MASLPVHLDTYSEAAQLRTKCGCGYTYGSLDPSDTSRMLQCVTNGEKLHILNA